MDAETQILYATLSDIVHQVSSPLSVASLRLRNVQESLQNEGLQRELAMVEGVIRKARRAVGSAGMLSKLSREAQVEVATQTVPGFAIAEIIRDVLSDAGILTDPGRRLAVDFDASDIFLRSIYEVPIELFEQALGNVIENAFKYSRSDSKIYVSANAEENDARIVCKNQGLEIASIDTSRMIERGWRSEAARMTSADGSGLGLWITNSIMETFGGALQIYPTDSDGNNQIELRLPVK